MFIRMLEKSFTINPTHFLSKVVTLNVLV